jgi:hypothetical protein
VLRSAARAALDLKGAKNLKPGPSPRYQKITAQKKPAMKRRANNV